MDCSHETIAWHEMVGWHRWLDGHEFEQAPGAGDRQGSLSKSRTWLSDGTDWTDFAFRLLTAWEATYRAKKVLVTQSCPTLCDPIDCSPPGSSVHGISQVSILEWVAVSFSKGTSHPRNQTQVSYTAGGFFTDWTMKKTHSEDCLFVLFVALVVVQNILSLIIPPLFSFLFLLL